MDRHKEKVINMILLGDFNLDYDKKHDVSYASNNMFELLNWILTQEKSVINGV